MICQNSSSSLLTPQQVLDTYYLDARYMLLEIAAMLDRYDAAVTRSGAPAENEVKLATLREAMSFLGDSSAPAERAVHLLESFASV